MISLNQHHAVPVDMHVWKLSTKDGPDSLRIDIPATTPARTISAVTSTLWEDLANSASKDCPREMINMKKIQCAEKMIRGAFVELYRGLGLIETYCLLNLAAFHEDSQEVQQAASARCIERRTCATPTVIVIILVVVSLELLLLAFSQMRHSR